MAHDVFHHDDGAVHQHPQRDCDAAERHQVCRNARKVQCDDRQRGAERHGERHDQRRLEVPECDCQDNEHQYDTLKESVFHCPAGIVHKIRLIVIRYDAYAFGQIFTDFLQFFMERFNDA